MTELAAWSYAGVFFGSLFLAWVLTPLALKLAIRKDVLDRPGSYKTQDSPVPYLGGVAIVTAFSIAVLAASTFAPPGDTVRSLVIVIAVGCGLAIVGLLDDVRGLGPLPRICLEVAGAVAVFAAGIRTDIFPGEAADFLLTLFWIVGVTNAFNLLDNMDGLSAGISAISAAFFLVIAAMNGQFLVAALAAGLAGCALGFLRHNFHPAKIYMGDAGSLFLGFLLAVIGIKLRFDGPVNVTFLVPIMVLGVPIFDTILVTSTRLSHGLNPFIGGRDHTSHRLVFIGIPTRVAVSLIYVAGITLGWLAIVLTRVDRGTGFMLAGLIATLATFTGVLLGMTPVYERSLRRRMMIVEVAPHEEEQAGTA